MLVVFEGLDGCGKSSVLRQVHKSFHNTQIVDYQETDLGKFLFSYLKSTETKMQVTQAMLFSAVIMETLNVVEYRKNPNRIYLCDRYIHSTQVYQHDGIYDDANIMAAVTHSRLIPIPDLTLYLKVSPETSLERLSRRELDLLELKDRNTLYNLYEKVMKNSANVVTINAERPFEQVVAECTKIIGKEYILRCHQNQ